MGHFSVTEFAKTAGLVRGDPSAHDYNAYGFRDVNSIVGDINQDWAWFTNREGSGHRVLFGQRIFWYLLSQLDQGRGDYDSVPNSKCIWS